MPKRGMSTEQLQLPDIEDLVAQADPIKKINHGDLYHAFDDTTVEVVRNKLISWYDKNQRILPWRMPTGMFMRNDPDGIWRTDSAVAMEGVDRAYAVWISEIMAQQTRVATVIGYYNRWMKVLNAIEDVSDMHLAQSLGKCLLALAEAKFSWWLLKIVNILPTQKWPTIQSLADASIEEVNSLWQGLGYYSRARRIHEAAIMITKQLGGRLPPTAAELEKTVPGVGRYTAAAVCSIVHNERVGVVDGNVIRVLARMRAVGCDSKAPMAIEHFWALVNKLVCPERPGDFNQAIMEFGAIVCTPKSPACDACPVSSHCRAYAETLWHKRNKAERLTAKKPKVSKPATRNTKDDEPMAKCTLCTASADAVPVAVESVMDYPYKVPKKKSREEHVAVCVLTKSKGSATEFLLVQRPEKGLLAGLWEYPSVVLGDAQLDETPHYETRQAAMTDYLHRWASTPQYIQCREFGLALALERRHDVGSVTHVFSHIKHHYCVERAVFDPDITEPCVMEGKTAGTRLAWRWVPEASMKSTPLSTAMRKVGQLIDKRGEQENPAKKTVTKACGKPKTIMSFFSKR